MEKQSSSVYHAKIAAKPSLSLFGILREALKISIRNGRPLLFILFFMFSSQVMIELAITYILLPVMSDYTVHSKALPKNGSKFDADSPVFKSSLKDMRQILTYGSIILSFACLVSVLSATASVHSTFEVYTAKVLSLREMLSGTRGRWKRALNTSIWMILIGAASATLFLLMFGVIGVMAEGFSVTLASIMVIAGGIFAVHLYVLWLVSLVVSVINDDSSGLKAINEASELMKGKKRQGHALMVLMILAGGAISQAFFFLQGKDLVTQLAMVLGVVISVPKILGICVWKLLTFAVFTVFYHECKMRKIEE